MKWVLLCGVLGALIAGVASEAFLRLVFESQRPSDPYIPNWNGSTYKASLIGALLGVVLGSWLHLRGSKPST
ncbi:MAG TPA: hypothetical protein VK934_01005 [Fimbriimonas sp.]|nr:hypothetical protein [Fimbriimonas sp.]